MSVPSAPGTPRRCAVPLAVVRYLVAIVWSVGLFTLATLHGLVTLRRVPIVDFWARAWGRSVLAILGVRLEVRGREHLATPGSRIVVCNHTSALDLPLFAAVTPPHMLNVGKRELRWVPFLNVAWWATDGVFLDRHDPDHAAAALAGVVAAMRARPRSVVLAPEGTRSRDGRLGRFKLGAWRLALETGAPLQPCVVFGAAACLPPGVWVPVPGAVRIDIHPPVPVDDRDLREQADALRARYLGWLGQAEEG